MSDLLSGVRVCDACKHPEHAALCPYGCMCDDFATATADDDARYTAADLRRVAEAVRAAAVECADGFNYYAHRKTTDTDRARHLEVSRVWTRPVAEALRALDLDAIVREAVK